jgi:predicted porin
MNKNILAIAIAAAVAAPSAFAAATVYGLAHMGVASQDDGTDSGFSVMNNSSRLGIKGDEDLGGGLKALYQMEFSVQMDGEGSTGNNGFGGQRNSFVGLGGGFGAVLLGRHDSPIKLVGRKYDLFGDQIGNSRSITGGNGTNGLIDGRHNNVIAYQSPKFGGFDVLAAYVPGGAYGDEQDLGAKAANEKGDALTFSLNGAMGAFDMGLGYINIGTKKVGAFAADFEAVKLGLGYTIGAAKIVANYQNDNMAKVTGGKGTRDVFGLGASYKVTSAGTIKGQYYVADNNGSTKNSGGSLLNIGYDHAMSKNTSAYVNYAMASNEDAAAYTVNLAGSGSGENFAATSNASGAKDNSAIAVGVIHKF